MHITALTFFIIKNSLAQSILLLHFLFNLLKNFSVMQLFQLPLI